MLTQIEKSEIYFTSSEPVQGQSAVQAAVGELLRLGFENGSISDSDIANSLLGVCADGITDEADAEALFALDRSGVARCNSWTVFFVEAITDYLVWQNRPTGIISEEQAEWLIDQTDKSKSVSALAGLVNILAEADRVPHWLPAAARGRIAAGWPGVTEALEEAQGGTQVAA